MRPARWPTARFDVRATACSPGVLAYWCGLSASYVGLTLELLHVLQHKALGKQMLLECFGLGFGDMHDAQVVLANRCWRGVMSERVPRVTHAGHRLLAARVRGQG